MPNHAAATASESGQTHPMTHRNLNAYETSAVRRLVWFPRGAGIRVGSGNRNEPRIPGLDVSQAVTASADISTTGSRFESMAFRANKVPPKVGDLLDVLLASTSPSHGRGCKVLRPLWVEEAMHRAYSFVRLVDARNRGASSTSEDSCLGDATAWEDAVACDLAIRFTELARDQEREVFPCCAILRDVVAALGALFGSVANVSFETRIDDVRLPGYKRRALVLATFELVCNALLHAFKGHAAGQIEVHLVAGDGKSACLRVADDGIGFAGSAPNLDRGVGAGLAGLLEADLAYDRIAGWTIAEIEFPLSASPSRLDRGRVARGTSMGRESGGEYPCRRNNVQYLR